MRAMHRVVFAVCVLGPSMAAAQPPGYESFENGMPAWLLALIREETMKWQAAGLPNDTGGGRLRGRDR